MNGKQAHMKLSFGQHLSQKQVQTLAPRMIQSMEILQMPLVELNERIEQELIENPVLELREKDPSLPDEAIPQDEAPQKRDVDEKELIVDEAHHNADDFERLVNLDQEVPSYFEDQARPSSNRIQESSDRHQDLMANVAERSETLQDHLLQQLGEWELEPALRKMCERIISALKAEDGGYLRIALRDLLPADAAPDQLELAEEALSIVQSLDPPGVAARDLRECLLLQLNVEIPHYQDVRTLIQNHLEDLRDNRIPQIQKATGFSQSQLQEALAELRKLEPKPARRFVESYAPSVTPDLSVVQEEGGRYVVKMDEGPSRNLYISKYYRQRLANGQATKEEREFIKRKVNAAQWLIESIEQRRATLMKVSQAIVDYQTKFLDNGPEFIEPLKMQQIADQVGVHVTTVSRAVDDKWIETPRGIFPLRRFFAGGTQTEDGEDIAWDRIRIELQKLIDHEDKSDPLSDDEIVKRMGAAGLKVARRTVTKYRQKMGIPSSRQRKDWSKQGE
jgi:RNA polymerase sigma-54 factor